VDVNHGSKQALYWGGRNAITLKWVDMPNKMRKPTVYLICGFIGSGKTTFARKLEKETGAIRITKDEWMVRMFGNKPPDDKFEEYDEKICNISRDLAFTLVKKGVDVIIDEGFWAREQRDEMKKRSQKSGAQAVLYYVRAPMEKMKTRVLERSKNPPQDSFEISEKMFDYYTQYWKPPTEDEGFIIVE
jgi:predicted kinase